MKASLAKVANAQASAVEAKGANVHAKAEDAKASNALAANVKASVERGEGTIFVARRNVPLLRHFARGAFPKIAGPNIASLPPDGRLIAADRAPTRYFPSTENASSTFVPKPVEP